jgi:hypothetical protein
MSRIKALYRSWAIPCSGTTVYAARHRSECLAKISEPGVRLRAERFYQQLDMVRPLHQEARGDFVVESPRHPAVKLLRQIPSIGPIRAALLVPCCKRPSVSVPSDNCGRIAGGSNPSLSAISTNLFQEVPNDGLPSL